MSRDAIGPDRHSPVPGSGPAVYSWSRCSVDAPTPPTGEARVPPAFRFSRAPWHAAWRCASSNSTDDPRERKRLGQLLIDELDALAGLPHCDLVVADRAQVHSHNGQRLQSKTYGYYRCNFTDGGVKGARIRIYHKTAVRQQVITSKVFLNTLLHEWEHHHDFAGLHLPRSPHTAGFYARLRALATALEVAFVMPPEPGADGTAHPSAA